MSNEQRRRTQNRNVPRQQYDREEAEEAEEEPMDVEEGEETDPTEVVTGNSPADIAEKLALQLETDPENPEVRAMAKYYIRKLYIGHGGLPFNKESAIPFDLDVLSSKEMVNVLENMVIFTARTRQKDLVGRALNTITNVGYILGGKDGEKVFNQVQNDDVLRNSLFEVFLGQKFGPLLTVLITASSYLSNLYRNYYEQHNGKPAASTGSSPSSTTGTPSTNPS